jgi:hypothetical protein
MSTPVLCILLCALAVQPPQVPKPDPLPVDVALEAAMDAYSRKPCADEMTVKFRGPGAEQRSDRFVIRLEPGETPRSGPRRMFLDLGQLKIFADHGTLTAINASAPGKYVQKEYKEPLTPATLAAFMPPVPLPQLALAENDLKHARSLTPYTPDVGWTSIEADTAAKPPTALIQGSGPSCSSALTLNADTGRLLKLTATIHGRAGDSTLEMTSHPVDPGEPASWAIKTDGRERVESVADLKPTPAK